MDQHEEQNRSSPLDTTGQAGNEVGQSERMLQHWPAPRIPRVLVAEFRKLRAQLKLQAPVVQERLTAPPQSVQTEDKSSPV